MVGFLAKTLSELHPTLRTNGMGIGNTHRRINVGVPISDKKNPLVRKYRRKRRSPTDQRSFHSLAEDFGSSVHHPFLEDFIEEQYPYVIDDIEEGELSRTVSLPSRVSDTSDVASQGVDWILEEHSRRYSSVCPSEAEEDSIQTHASITTADEQEQLQHLQYDEFMNRLRSQLPQSYGSTENNTLLRRQRSRQASFASITSRGSIPTIYEAVSIGHPGDYFKATTFEKEYKTIAGYSIPLIFTFLLEQIFPLVCSLTVGHLGKTELAAVSLASMTSNITLAIFAGIATSLDTLCPQAFGAGRYYSVGVHLQRCILMSFLIYIPFAIFWWYSKECLSLVVPEKELILLTSKFLRVLILGAPAYILFENLKRYLQCQGIFDAGIYVLIICAPTNVLISYTLVWNKYIGVGFLGAAIAVVINFWMMFLLLLAYTIKFNGKKCWGGFSKKALTHWKDLWHLASSGIVMLEAEELSYELLTLFSSYFGVDYLAAQSAMSTTAALLYMIPFAIGISTSTRIANYIGAKKPECANISGRVGLTYSFGAGLFNCFLLIFGRNYIAGIFTKDENVQNLIRQVLPLVGVVQNFDALNAVAGSCLRGQGMQALGSLVNLITYYIFAIPLAFILGWALDLKLYGLWIGIGSGMLIIGVVEAYYVLFPDWVHIMNYAEILKETEEDEESELEEEFSESDDDNDELINENTRLLV